MFPQTANQALIVCLLFLLGLKTEHIKYILSLEETK